jgi:hypothetical protein
MGTCVMDNHLAMSRRLLLATSTCAVLSCHMKIASATQDVLLDPVTQKLQHTIHVAVVDRKLTTFKHGFAPCNKATQWRNNR